MPVPDNLFDQPQPEVKYEGGTITPDDLPPAVPGEVVEVYTPHLVSPFATIDSVKDVLRLLGADAALEVWTKEAEALEVKDDSGQTAAVELAGRAKKLAKQIEKARKEWVGPFNERVKAINSLCKGYQGPLKQIETGLKAKIGDYGRRKELERRKAEEAARKAKEEAQAKLDAEAKEANVEPVTLPEPVIPRQTGPVRTEVAAASQRKVWKFEVEAPDDVPREYLTVDERAIREAVKAGVRSIAGVKIYEHTETVIRT